MHFFKYQEVGNYMSVCKMFFFSFPNLMKKCWLAPDRVLASSERNAFCQCHLTLLCLFEGKCEPIEF